jgi:septum formation topological specificity factor MinE
MAHKIEQEDLPLIVSHMTLIAAKEREAAQHVSQLERMKEALAMFVEKHYGVNIRDGQWSLDPNTGELTENDSQRS